MKTQIIQLEAHDDIISARDKLKTAQAGRIILVWPGKKKTVLNRYLDLTLLHRYSNQLGVQLGFVSTQPDIHYYAGQMGIPVFRNLRAAQTNRWRFGRRRGEKGKPDLLTLKKGAVQKPQPILEPEWLSKPITRLFFFSLSWLAILSLIAVIMPNAKIEISPIQDELSVDLIVQTNPDITQPLLAGQLPLLVNTISVEGRLSIPTSGTMQVPEKSAVGNVTFNNLTEKEVKVAAGTVVTTLDSPATRFLSVNEIIVPAGIGMKRSTAVVAQIPGSIGNVPSGSIQAIEGPLGLQLSVLNQTETRQGSNKTSNAPSAKDRQSLFEKLSSSLKESALLELKESFPNDGSMVDFPIEESLDLLKVVEEIYSPAEEQPSDHLDLILRLEYSYKYISADHLITLAAPIMLANKPTEFDLVPGTLRIKHSNISKLDNQGNIRWNLTLHQDMLKIFEVNRIAANIRGLPVSIAKQNLHTNLGLVEEPRIEIKPSWWPYLPILPYQIDISAKQIGP